MSLKKSLENLREIVKECSNLSNGDSHPNTITARRFILTHCNIVLKEVEHLKETTLEDDQDGLKKISLIMILIHWHNDSHPINQCMNEIYQKLNERICNQLPTKPTTNFPIIKTIK